MGVFVNRFCHQAYTLTGTSFNLRPWWGRSSVPSLDVCSFEVEDLQREQVLGSGPTSLPLHSGTGCQTGTTAMGRTPDTQLLVRKWTVLLLHSDTATIQKLIKWEKNVNWHRYYYWHHIALYSQCTQWIMHKPFKNMQHLFFICKRHTFYHFPLKFSVKNVICGHKLDLHWRFLILNQNPQSCI